MPTNLELATRIQADSTLLVKQLSEPVPIPPDPPIPPIPVPIGSAVLEDFTSLRTNGDGQPLWSPYTGSSGGGPNQTGKVQDGRYLLTVPQNNRPYFQFMPAPYVNPYGFVRNYIKNGSIDATTNRLMFWMRASVNVPRRSDGGAIAEVGTYFKGNDGDPSQQGDHRYHYLDMNIIKGRWMLVTLSNQTQHKVGQSGGTNWPLIPGYFDLMTRFYFTDEYGSASVWGNSTWDFDQYTLATVSNEPDTQVSSITAVYTGARYELSWAGPKKSVVRYDVRMNGTPAGTVQTPGNDYTGVFWASANVAESEEVVFDIQPQGQPLYTVVRLPKRS